MSTKKQSLVVSPGFLTSAATMSKDVRSALIKTLSLLAQDVRHPSLQCKKVQGSRDTIYECRVDQRVRLIYDVIDGKIRCWYVGIHDDALRFATSHSRSEELLVDDIEVKEIAPELNEVFDFLEGKEAGIVFSTIDWEEFTKLLQV